MSGAMALVEFNGLQLQCNALTQPDVKVGDYVLVHANLLVAIISDEEAMQMLAAARELDAAIAREAGDRPPGQPTDTSRHAGEAREK